MTDATTRTYVGTATSASEDGSVYVALSQDVTLPDDDDGEHGLGVEMPTTVAVDEGDEVLVTVFGGGVMKAPVVTGNPGWGDSVQLLAEQAETVATATGQHFWEGDDGAHVTQVTRTEWESVTPHGTGKGPNSLWNSLGMLFCDGLTNLLAILTTGIAIYDGNGNNAENIVASFDADEVRIGGSIPDDGSATALVRFFDSDDDKGATLDGYVNQSYTPTSDDGWGVQVQDTYTKLHTRTHDGEMTVVNGGVGESQLELGQSLYWEDGPDTYSTVESTARLAATAESGTDPTQTARAEASIEVVASTLNDTTGTAYIDMFADELTLTDPNAGSFIDTCTVSISSAITAIMRPTTTYSGSNTTATATANGWRLTWFNTVLQSDGYPENFYTFNNGVITATKTCSILISGSMYWNSGGTGQYGFGVFTGSTAGSGTEYSVFNYKASSSGQHQVTFPPRLFRLTAGNSLCIGRYEISGAVYRNGTNMSYLTIEVVR